GEREHFDSIVFDTAPTGHTIRLMSLPELMGVWVEGMLQRREKINKNYESLLSDGQPKDDPISWILNKRKKRFAQVRDILLDTEITSFVYVLTAEKLPILETQKAIILLQKYHIPVPALIINKLLPDVTEGDFLKKRKEQEMVYLKEIKTQFKDISLYKIPMLEKDISGKSDLEILGQYLIELMNSFSGIKTK
ncbi:MAG TPA: TRC40/GET3/ArsA family transport-energizing ATPase, partial [Balneolales bacterium]|nr:TRC40/GET3/ArsA family transport-energizing ATPase [Balneolales bacterium]